MPRVSIIIPTYNRAHLLSRAINSVLGQDYEDFELIIVDDGSSDNTHEVVQGYTDERIRYIKVFPNSGWSSKPRNVGIANSFGEYIALLDSDDEWMPSFLSTLVAKMEQSPDSVGVIYCGLVVQPMEPDYPEHPSHGNKPRIIHAHRSGRVWPQSLSEFICPMSSSLIRRRCFDHIGMFDESNVYQDHQDMVIRLSKAYDFDFVPEILARYYYHTGQRSRAFQTMRLKALRGKYAEDFKRYPVENGVAALTLGMICLREGHKLEAVRYILPNLRYCLILFSRYGRVNSMTKWQRLSFALSFLRRGK